MSLESGYTATLTVHRPKASGGDLVIVFETWAGGKRDTAESKHRNPVTRLETARGGMSTRGNVTLTRECDAAAWALIPTLEASAGIDDCTAVRQMVGPRGDTIGNPFTITGKLKAPEYPDYDLNGTGIGMLSVEVSSDESAA
jgi:hypothetical protein